MKIHQLYTEDISVAKGSFKIPIKGLIDRYRDRYDELSRSKRFSHVVYRLPGKRTVVVVKVPSESLENFTYDVAIDFLSIGPDFQNCDVTMFSNAPSFAYTCCYVFYNHGHENDPPRLIAQLLKAKRRGAECLLVAGLESKFPDQMLIEPPKVRNPAEIAVPDKTVYHALMYLEDRVGVSGLLGGQLATERTLQSQVRSFDQLMRERKRQERREKEDHERERRSIDREFKEREADLDRRNGLNVMAPKRANGAIRVKGTSTKRTTRARSPSSPRSNRR